MVEQHYFRIYGLCLVILVTGLSYCKSQSVCECDPCYNNGTCIVGTDNTTSYTCNCTQGFTGINCETSLTPTDPCDLDPCYHDSTCVTSVDGFKCMCTEHYMGEKCEGIRRYCNSENPCQNNAVCEDIPSGGYRCYCSPGYYGNMCENEVNECMSDTCYNSGQCDDLVNGFLCHCPPWYTGLRCEVELTTGCESSPCQQGATCTDTSPGRYTCTCPAGYTGVTCDIDIDECMTATCFTYQVCTDLLNAYRCDCPAGTTGSLCNEYIDTCVSNPCLNSGTCEHEGDRYVCKCPQGYAGINCEIQTDPCYPSPCLHGATCQADYNVSVGYTCQCGEGFVGARCEGKVASCGTSSSTLCHNGGTCVENIGTAGYTCECVSGYTGNMCETQNDGCLVTECYNGGQCLATTQGHTCQCMPGWTGVMCETDIDECQVDTPCVNGGQCVNVPGTYICICDTYWTGQNCEEDELECARAVSPCHNNGTCVEVFGGPPTCQCAVGTTGENCETLLDGCVSDPCSNGATCINVLGNYTCNCVQGYTGTTCDTEIDECQLYTPCVNNGTCTDLLNSYTCTCRQGYTGVNCSVDINGCNHSNCLHGSTCQDEVNGYTCLCTPGYTGIHCDLDVDECDSDPCHNNGICSDLENSYTCKCQAGFTGVTCETNINECEPDPCNHGSQCIDDLDGYKCICVPGYEGKNCSEDIPECVSSPCYHGGTCTEPVVNGYHCVCLDGIHGDRCQHVTIATFDGLSVVKYESLLPSNNKRKRSVTKREEFEKSHDLKMERIKRQTNSDRVDMRFWFTTSILDGVLLLATGTSTSGEQYHVSLVMSQGHLHVSQNLHGNAQTDDIILTPVNQIVSHYVAVTITTSFTNVSLDGCLIGQKCHVMLQTNLTGPSLNLNGPMMVGGVDHVTPYLRSKLQTVEGFKGCFGNFTINNEPVSMLPVSQNSSAASIDQSKLPSSGCESHDLCPVDLCNNGGQCVDLWFRKTCKCQPGYIGLTCNTQNTANFVTRSFLHMGNFTKVTTLSLWISTNSSSGMILYTLDLDLLALYVDGGQLVLHLVVNGDDIISRVGNLATGDWFHVTAQFGPGVYTLQVSDSADDITGSATGTVGNLLDVYTPLFLGQLHDHPAVDKWRSRSSLTQYQSFIGCVQNLTINDVFLDLQSATQSIFGNDPAPPSPGCHRDDVCDQSACQNKGACLGGWGQDVCTCRESFTGHNCEEGQAVTFTGDNSYLDLQLDMSKVTFGDSGEFEFRTRDQTATLMFIQFYTADTNIPGHSLEFSVYRTSLQVTITSQEGVSDQFPDNVTDGAWHSVSWVKDQHNLTVTLGSRSLTSTFDPYLTSSKVKIYVGGKPFHPDNPGYIVGSMKGCVRNIKFNNDPIDYLATTLTTDGLVTKQHNIQTGCHGDDMCTVNPCSVNSECEDLWNARVCTCQNGWEGDACNTSINDCGLNLCKNGTCEDGHLNYTCLCNNGYTGQYCESVYNACSTEPCYAGGTVNCTSVFPAQFVCKCVEGWTGSMCETDVNECESSPCLNQGKCSDMVNGYTCECTGDYTGSRCEQTRICTSQPCYNGGSCVADDNNRNYTCTCLQRYSGKQCQIYDFCDDNLCQHNSTCVSGSQGYTCDCDSNFYGVYCQFVDYCASLPCQNNADCLNDKDTFRCSCTEFFSGTVCELPVNRCNTNPCRNGANCFYNSSDTSTDYVCQCLEGYSGLHCEKDINECLSNPCMNGGTCTESSSTPWNFYPGFHCQCVEGYYGNICQNETDECVSGPCENGGTCVDGVDSYTCQCLTGFDGEWCQLDIRGCSSNPCQNNAFCEETIDKAYTCQCQNGFTDGLCTTNINDCVGNECENGAKCVDGVDSYTCQCLPGYSGNMCRDVIDACYSQPCLHGGACQYRGLCDCPSVVTSCGWHNDTCQTVSCSNTPGCTSYTVPYTCDCSSAGYSGATCDTDVDECLTRVACEHGGVCTNTAGGYTCDCRDTGYTGGTCDMDINECDGPTPCYNGGVCENFSGSYKCRCPAGWTGQTCGQLIDHCTDLSCDHSGQCVNSMSGYTCDCTGTGYEGTTCSSNVNECIDNVCTNGGLCIDGAGPGVYTCDCTDTGHQGSRCETKIDHCAGAPCQHNGTCMGIGTNGGTYVCTCTDTGYQGRDCDVDVDECDAGNHDCIEGATCQNVAGSYTCLCPQHFSGVFCETDLSSTAPQSGSDNNTGVIVASVVIIIAILVALGIYAYWYTRKSRRMQGRYKPSLMEQSGPGLAPGIPLDKMLDQNNGERLI